MNDIKIHFSFPIVSILGILFVAFKLTGVVDWAWKWVLAPFWIPALVFIFLLFSLGISFAVFELFFDE